MLCLHVAVPQFSSHATVSSSSSQSSGYSNISRSSYEMLERLVISLSYLIHVFLKFQERIDSCVFNPIYHPLGDVTYHLGYNFVTSQRPTSKGLVFCWRDPYWTSFLHVACSLSRWFYLRWRSSSLVPHILECQPLCLFSYWTKSDHCPIYDSHASF